METPMHSSHEQVDDSMLAWHARRLGPRADRIATLYARGLRLSGLGRSMRSRLGRLVTQDPAGALAALAHWPAERLAEQIRLSVSRSLVVEPFKLRDLGLARMAWIAAVGHASEGDWSDELARAWCWHLDAVCELLVAPGRGCQRLAA